MRYEEIMCRKFSNKPIIVDMVKRGSYTRSVSSPTWSKEDLCLLVKLGAPWWWISNITNMESVTGASRTFPCISTGTFSFQLSPVHRRGFQTCVIFSSVSHGVCGRHWCFHHGRPHLTVVLIVLMALWILVSDHLWTNHLDLSTVEIIFNHLLTLFLTRT